MTRAGTIVLRSGTREHTVERLPDGRVQIGAETFAVHRGTDGSLHIAGDRAVRAWAVTVGATQWVFLDGRVFALEEQRPDRRGRRSGHHHGTLSAPMPATVRRITVAVGDRVRRGDTLVILEAMKMELPIRAAVDGIVDAVNCREGDLVQPGTLLIELEEND